MPVKGYHLSCFTGYGSTIPLQEVDLQDERFCEDLRLGFVFCLVLAAVEVRARDPRKHRRSASSKRASGT